MKPSSASDSNPRRVDLRLAFFEHGIMQAFRECRGDMFRLMVPHRPNHSEISYLFFASGEITYDPFDEIEFHFCPLNLAGHPYAYVVAYLPNGEREIVIDPFPFPHEGREAIPPFPEEE